MLLPTTSSWSYPGGPHGVAVALLLDLAEERRREIPRSDIQDEQITRFASKNTQLESRQHGPANPVVRA